jgi:hypothetical protein
MGRSYRGLVWVRGPVAGKARSYRGGGACYSMPSFLSL